MNSSGDSKTATYLPDSELALAHGHATALSLQKALDEQAQAFEHRLSEKERELSGKEQKFEERYRAMAELEHTLRNDLQELRSQLVEKQAALEESQRVVKSLEQVLQQRDETQRRHAAELAEMVKQKNQLELVQKQTDRLLTAQAEQIRAGVRAEIEALESRLRDKEHEIKLLRDCVPALQRKDQVKSDEQRGQIAETWLANDGAHSSNDKRPSEGAASRAAQIDARSDAPFAQQRDAGPAKSEQALQAQIATLLSDLREKHILLNSRNEELVQVKAELDRVKEHAYDLEGANRRCQEAATADNEKMRNEFQAQLAFLQAELSQKQWSLDDRQALVSGLEQRLRAQIDQLENRLEQPQSRPAKGEFILGEPKLPEEPSERDWRIKEPVAMTSQAGGETASSHTGRWRTGRGWKRRWRS